MYTTHSIVDLAAGLLGVSHYTRTFSSWRFLSSHGDPPVTTRILDDLVVPAILGHLHIMTCFHIFFSGSSKAAFNINLISSQYGTQPFHGPKDVISHEFFHHAFWGCLRLFKGFLAGIHDLFSRCSRYFPQFGGLPRL